MITSAIGGSAAVGVAALKFKIAAIAVVAVMVAMLRALGERP